MYLLALPLLSFLLRARCWEYKVGLGGNLEPWDPSLPPGSPVLSTLPAPCSPTPFIAFKTEGSMLAAGLFQYQLGGAFPGLNLTLKILPSTP